MVRSNWKIPYVNKFLLRQFIYNEDFYDTISYVWTASGRVFNALIEKEIFLSRGNSKLKLEISDNMFNTNLGEYVISKNMGLSIHERNKKKLKKKKGSKKKKGVLANPLGYRLDLSGTWQDFWSLKHLTYTEFLHSSLKIRKFITSFFEFEKFWKTGILLNNIKITNTQNLIKVYINWYAGKSYDKKKYHYIDWYKKHVLKLIYYFRIWQTRLYWLRYKFMNVEKNIFHRIIKSKSSIVYYNLKTKLSKNNYVKNNVLKLAYTKKGNEVVSNIFKNLGKKMKNILQGTLKFLISKEKTAHAKFYGLLQSKEKEILNLKLKQEKKIENKFNIKTLKQIFMQIASKKEKWVGLNNLLNNKGINIWNLFLNLLKDKNIETQILIFMKLQRSYKVGMLDALTKIKNFLQILLSYEKKDLISLKNKIRKIKATKWFYFIIQILKGDISNISEFKYKNNLKTWYLCYFVLYNFKKKKLKTDLLTSYIEKIDLFLKKVEEEFETKTKIPFQFKFNFKHVYNLNDENTLDLKETRTRSIMRLLKKRVWKKLYALKNLNQFKFFKRKPDRKISSSDFLFWLPRFFFEKIKWKVRYRTDRSFLLKKLKPFFNKKYYYINDWYRSRFINKKLFRGTYIELKKSENKQIGNLRRIYNKLYDFKKEIVKFAFYKKLRFSITLNAKLFKAIKSNIFRFIYEDYKTIIGPSLLNELWNYGVTSNLRSDHLKKHKFEKNFKSYNFSQYDLKKYWQEYNDPYNRYGLVSRRVYVIDLDKWRNPFRLFRSSGNFFYHSKKESRKENFFGLIINKSLFNYSKLKKFLPRTLRSWSLKRQIFGPPIKRKIRRKNTFKNRKRYFWWHFRRFLKERSYKKFGIVKRKLGKWKTIDRNLNSKKTFISLSKRDLMKKTWNRSYFFLENIVQDFDLYKYLKEKSWKKWILFFHELLNKKKSKYKKNLMTLVFWLPWLMLNLACIKFTRLRSYYKEPFPMSEINWVLWLSFKKLFLFGNKSKFIKRYHRFFSRTWQNFNFKRRIFNLKYRVYYNNNMNTWINRIFSTKWILKTRGYFKAFILKFIRNKHLQRFVIQRTKISVVKRNQNWIKSQAFNLKKKFYNLRLSKFAVLKDFKLLEHKEKRDQFIQFIRRKWKFKKSKAFWNIKKKRYFIRVKRRTEKRNINFRRTIKNRYWKKRIYYMTHENPFKNYAGFIGLHKDFGKYIDFSKGKLGGYINHIKKLIKLESFFSKMKKKSFIIRKSKNLFRYLKTKWDFMFKLFFSKNLRRLDSNFKTARSNFNMFYKGHFYGKLKKKYFRKSQATFLIPKKAVKTMLLKTQAFAANHNSNKKFKDNWWNLRKIRLKFSRYLKMNINNLHLKFPLKDKVFQKLKAKSLDLFKQTHFLKRENTNEIKKLQKLKKILVFVLKLKQVLLNPKLYNKIWNSLKIFDKNATSKPSSINRLILKNLNKAVKSRTNMIYQVFIDNFRNIFESISKRKLQIFVFSVDNNNINAELLARYIIIKILQKYSFKFLLNPMKQELMKLIKLNVLDGFRIRLSGRFNRRQRSKVITINHGLLPLTEKSKNIDYNERTMVLKFSIMSIKILLCRTSTWIQKKKLQIVSPLLKRENLLQKFEKKYTKYKNIVLNSGFYNQTIRTNSTFDHKGVYDLKKKIISNEKQFEILKNKKKSIFERIFKHPYKIYENPSKNKYFVDETLRAYNIVKDFRKNSSKQRWKSFRNFLKTDLNLGKLSLEKKLNRIY